MASISLALALAMLALLCAHVSAQSCTSALIGLMPCLSYITGNTTAPSSSCCSQLANVVQSEPRCLCIVLNGGASQLGITINKTQALMLPRACKIQTPSVSKCNDVAGGSSGSPPESPVGSSATTPSTPSGTSNDYPATPAFPSVPSEGSGSKTTPSSTGESSDASGTKLSRSLLLPIVLFGAFISSFTTLHCIW